MAPNKGKTNSDDELPKLAAPAVRALSGIGVTNLSDLTKFKEEEITQLHGIGPHAMRKLKLALKSHGLSFAN